MGDIAHAGTLNIDAPIDVCVTAAATTRRWPKSRGWKRGAGALGLCAHRRSRSRIYGVPCTLALASFTG
jgi:hypothetical protein